MKKLLALLTMIILSKGAYAEDAFMDNFIQNKSYQLVAINDPNQINCDATSSDCIAMQNARNADKKMVNNNHKKTEKDLSRDQKRRARKNTKQQALNTANPTASNPDSTDAFGNRTSGTDSNASSDAFGNRTKGTDSNASSDAFGNRTKGTNSGTTKTGGSYKQNPKPLNAPNNTSGTSGTGQNSGTGGSAGSTTSGGR